MLANRSVVVYLCCNRAGKRSAPMIVRRMLYLLLLVMGNVIALLQAARIPIHIYTTADGLPTSSAECIARDSRGFVWLCTPDGLVRFDGYTFVTYDRQDGPSDRAVTAFLEAHDGS